MKKISIVLTLLISILVINMQAQGNKKVNSQGIKEITFEKEVHDFGTLNEGDIVETTFKFTNTSTIPLTITKIKSTCGCTVPKDWKKTAIQPGEKSQFSVKFNTKNKPNKQNKRITITSNAKKNYFVTIKANVIPNPEMQKAREERMKKWKEKRAAEKLKNPNAAASLKKVSSKNASLKKPTTIKAASSIKATSLKKADKKVKMDKDVKK